MITNYFRLALRQLLKNKRYSAINIFGLAIGLAACLLIFRMVYFEWTFDHFHPHYDRIARVVTESHSEEGVDYTTGIPLPAMDAMQTAIPQFEQIARVHSTWPTMTVPDPSGAGVGKKIATDGQHEVGLFTEPSFFRIFKWTWLDGDAHTALAEPNTVVINRAMAEKCFGDWRQAMGKTLVMDNLVSLTVRGVVENAPDNTDFPVHVFISYLTFRNNQKIFEYSMDWGSTSSNDQAFVLLRSPDQFQAANQVLAGVGKTEYKNNNINSRTHLLQALSDIHYDDRFGGHLGTHMVRWSRLLTLALIGVMILLLACFNFINLATAQAVARSREVGVRKSLGGTRRQLLGQFIGETALIVMVAVALGSVLALALSPLLKQVSEVPDHMPFLTQPVVMVFIAAVTVITTLLSGFYPAWILSRFEPVRALKNNITTRLAGGVSMRKLLVVFQFMVAQGLIIGALVAISQMEYLRTMDIGYQPDLVYTFRSNNDSISLPRFETFKQRIQDISGVQSASWSSDTPTSSSFWSSNFAVGGTKDAPFNIFMKLCDADYLRTYGLRLKAGRWLTASDTLKEVVINETTARKLGYANTEEIIGKEFRMGGGRFYPIVGVLSDFHANSAHDEIKPMVLFCMKKHYGLMGLKIQGEQMDATLAAVQQAYDNTFPEQVFEGEFLDESIAEFYRNESRFTAMCKGFALLAVLISCLGLFGLASLMATQRAKEIGVRKVLGASSSGILLLLYKDFVRLVLVALLLASPLAWYGMNAWLSDFVYRVPLSGWIFAMTGLVAVLVAIFTVSFEGLKAAWANPVKSLRNE
jgi:putative ABC transport system permease protein